MYNNALSLGKNVEFKKSFWFSIFLIAIFSHFLMPTIMPGLLNQVLGILLITGIIYWFYIKNGDIITFILIIYIFSHFDIGINQGGAFNIISFFCLLLGYNYLRDNNYLLENKKYLQILTFLLLFFNIIGWITVNKPGLPNLFAILGFLGYLFVFTISSKIYLSPRIVKLFIITNIVLLVYMALVGLNMRLNLIYSKSILFGVMDSYLGAVRVGTTMNYHASAEYAMLSFILLFTIYISKFKNIFEIKSYWYFISFISVVVIFILCQMRSNFFLTIFFIPFSLLYFFILNRYKIFKISKYFVFFTSITLIFILISPLLEFSFFLDRIREVDFSRIFTWDSITHGRDINRQATFEYTLFRLVRENWFLGYGWSNIKGNQIAWFGTELTEFFDPHSLYLSLPMVFGYSGGIVFLLIILVTFYRLIDIQLLHSKNKHYLMPLVYGFTFLILFFLINQIKATILSDAGYFMIFWIWLGLANSVVNTIKKDISGF